MIRLALPKGRNLEVALAAFRAAGLLSGLDLASRSLRLQLLDDRIEVLSLKDWDIPVYVEHGVADVGIVGSDVLAEMGGDLLVPLRLLEGRSRMSLIGRAGARPAPGSQVRLATKYPNTARQFLDGQPWGAEIVELSGSIELAPILELAEVALDIVQTGRTLVENDLVEIETVAEVAACLVVNRASYQRHRAVLNDWIGRLERAEVVA
jgi:ATP phosphoribosyltransferase